MRWMRRVEGRGRQIEGGCDPKDEIDLD